MAFSKRLLEKALDLIKEAGKLSTAKISEEPSSPFTLCP
jgi:hypothetical protein